MSKHLTRLRLSLCFSFFVLKNILKIRLLCIFEKQISHFSTQNIFDQFDGRLLYFDKYLQRTEIFTLIALTSVGIFRNPFRVATVYAGNQQSNGATRRMINKLIKIYCGTLEKILLNSTNSRAPSYSLSLSADSLRCARVVALW